MDALVEDIETIDSRLEELSEIPSLYSAKMDYFLRMSKGETPYNLDPLGREAGFFVDSIQVSAPWITKHGDWKNMDNIEKMGLIMGSWSDIKPRLMEQGEVEVYPGVFVDTMYLIGFAREIEKVAGDCTPKIVSDVELEREVLRIDKRELVDLYANSVRIPGYVMIVKTPEFKPLSEHLDDTITDFERNPERDWYPYLFVNPKTGDYVTMDNETGVVRTDRIITRQHRPSNEDIAQIKDILLDMEVDIVNWHYNWPSIQLPDFHEIQTIYSELSDEDRERIPLTDFVGLIKATYCNDPVSGLHQNSS